MSSDLTPAMVTVTVDDLERHPEAVLRKAQKSQVTICNETTPVAMFVPIDVWRDYIRRLADSGGHVPGYGPVADKL